MNQIILVTCAAGSVGRELVKLLSAHGNFKIRAGVRNLQKGNNLFKGLQNVEVVMLDEIESTAKAAFDGVYGLYLIIAEPHPADKCFPTWLKSAKEAGVKHVVYQSAITAAANSPVVLNAATHNHEEAIKASGLPFTFLRPTAFNQNIEKYHLPTLKLSPAFILGCSNHNSKYSLVDVRDIAAAAEKIFEDKESHLGKSYPLTTELLSDDDQAKILTDILGRVIAYNKLTKEEYSAVLSEAGLPEETVQAMVDLQDDKENGATLPLRPFLSQILGRPGITFEQYVRDNKQLLQV